MRDLTYESRALDALEMLIDSDYPPGLAARDLARAVVNLVQDIGSMDAVQIAIEIDRMAAVRGRPRGN